MTDPVLEGHASIHIKFWIYSIRKDTLHLSEKFPCV